MWYPRKGAMARGSLEGKHWLLLFRSMPQTLFLCDQTAWLPAFALLVFELLGKQCCGYRKQNANFLLTRREQMSERACARYCTLRLRTKSFSFRDTTPEPAKQGIHESRAGPPQRRTPTHTQLRCVKVNIKRERERTRVPVNGSVLKATVEPASKNEKSVH